MQQTLSFLLVISLALVFACNDSGIVINPNDLEEAKEHWESLNAKDYSVDVERICFCPPPSRYTMVVENGEIAQVIDTGTGEAIQHLAGYSTIDELFSWLEKVAAQNPQTLELEFHPELGYPTFIDYNQSDMIADEEMLMKLENLQTE